MPHTSEFSVMPYCNTLIFMANKLVNYGAFEWTSHPHRIELTSQNQFYCYISNAKHNKRFTFRRGSKRLERIGRK